MVNSRNKGATGERQVAKWRNRLESTINLLSSLASIIFAGLAVFGINTVENLLFAILFYLWGRDI